MAPPVRDAVARFQHAGPHRPAAWERGPEQTACRLPVIGRACGQATMTATTAFVCPS
jgi:hypothetical protein